MNENPSNNKPVLKTLSPEKIESGIKSFTNYFLFGGVLLIFFSLLHLVDLLQNNYNQLKLFSIVINLIYGFCFIFCAYLLRNRKAVLVYLFGGLLVINIVTSILFGSWINILGLILGIVIFIYLYVLKYQGALR